MGVPDAGSPYRADITITGQVTNFGLAGDGGAPARHLEVQTCAPNGSCASEIVPIEIETTTAVPDIPIGVGSIVSVGYHLGVDYGCAQLLTIDNVSNWGGLTNTVRSQPGHLLVASDGTPPPNDGDPPQRFASGPSVYVARVPKHCPDTGVGCGWILADNYDLRFFQDPTQPGAGIVVHAGDSPAMWDAAGERVFLVDLRSYQTTICDDYKNWAFWLTGM
jgi:hypothetical protein